MVYKIVPPNLLKTTRSILLLVEVNGLIATVYRVIRTKVRTVQAVTSWKIITKVFCLSSCSLSKSWSGSNITLAKDCCTASLMESPLSPLKTTTISSDFFLNKENFSDKYPVAGWVASCCYFALRYGVHMQWARCRPWPLYCWVERFKTETLHLGTAMIQV